MARAEKGRTLSRSRKKRNPIVIMVMLLLVFFTGSALGYSVMGDKEENGGGIVDAILPSKKLEPVNILVVGYDQRGNEKSRADVIMMARLRPEEKEVSLLSIPRDTRVPIKGHGNEKINHAMAYGDIELLQQTVEEFTGLEVDYYVKTNFEGFENIIDILGGVTIDVEKNMYYRAEGINIKAGLQTLDGNDALGYVRFRSDGLGDVGRVERQQKFVNALLEEVKEMSLSEALKVGEEVLKQVQTDMPITTMTKYGKKFIGISVDQLETHTIPGHDLRDGLWYWVADKEKMKVVLDEFMNGIPDPEPEVVEGEEAVEK